VAVEVPQEVVVEAAGAEAGKAGRDLVLDEMLIITLTLHKREKEVKKKACNVDRKIYMMQSLQISQKVHSCKRPADHGNRLKVSQTSPFSSLPSRDPHVKIATVRISRQQHLKSLAMTT
jgi:hypothetical protein